MRHLFLSLLLICVALLAQAQDDCSSASVLCSGYVSTGSTIGATADITDPPLSCGDNTVDNSVWFTVQSVGTGLASVTVADIDGIPGLEMEVFTGSCGSLTPVAASCANADGPGGSMVSSFNVTPGNTYYIMVDGALGNGEDFTILADATNNALLGAPQAFFTTSLFKGCTPLTVNVHNLSSIYGGTNITYQWQVDAGAPINSSGADTSFLLSSVGAHTIYLTVCNDECGCSQFSRQVYVQELYPHFTFLPATTCIGSPISFSGTAVILPAFPVTNPNVTLWQWDFNDPNSGAANTPTGQNVVHTFVGPGTSFNVTLTATGVCGPEVYSQTVTLLQQPVIDPGPDLFICEGQSAALSATVTNGTNPITYNWVGAGISCTNCQTTSADGLSFGVYNITVDIVDANGCTADTNLNVTVNQKPVVSAGGFLNGCMYSTVQLNALPVSGTAPYSYVWSPGSGLSDSTTDSPTTVVTGLATYCVVMTDMNNCASDADCVDIIPFPPPTINSSNFSLCASDPNPVNTFTVAGTGAGSTFSWALSADYATITGANVDSSSIDVSLPTGVVASYSYTVIVTDGVTGCTDTVTTSFNVTSGLGMTITPDAPICLGDSITLTATNATNYAWTASPAYSFADSTLATQTVKPTVTTTFTVTGSSGSCSQVLTSTITVNAVPTVAAAPIVPFCGCSSVVLDGTGSSAAMNYLWTSFGGNLVISPNSLVSSSFICDPDSFRLRVTNPATGCFSDSIIVALQANNPADTVALTPSIICNGTPTNITLDGTGSDTNPGTIYHWTSNNPGAVIADTTALVTSVSISSATTFTLTVTNAAGCDSTYSASVTIYPLPTISATPSTLCSTDVLQSTIDINGASPGSTYNWTTVPGCVVPNSSSSASQLFDFTACGTGTFNFQVLVTDAVTSCSTTLNQSVTINTAPVVVVSSDVTICEGDTAVVFASGATSYLWSNLAMTDTVSLTGLTAGASPYHFTVTGTTGGCTDTGSVNVIVNPVPVTNPITGAGTVCESDTGTIYSVTPVVGNYVWSISGGSITSGQGTNQVSVNWAAPGAGNISVQDTGISGCYGAVQSLPVTIGAKPVAAAAPIPTICGCNTVNLDGTGSTAGMNYLWTSLGGNSITSPASLVTTATVCSNDTFRLRVSDPITSCYRDTLITVLVTSRPDNQFSLTPNIICNGSPTVITLDGSGSDINPGTLYHWASDNPGVIITDTMAITTTATVFTTTAFTFTVTSASGCDSVVTDTVRIYPPPVISATPAIVCITNTLQSTIDITGASPGSTYNWTVIPACVTPSSTSASSQLFDFTTCGTGVFNFTVIVTDAVTGCSSALNQSVTVSNGPSLAVSPDVTICEGDTAVIFASGATTYSWTGGATTDTVTLTGLTAGGSPYAYTVTGTTGSCFDTLTVNVFVNPVPVTTAINGSNTVCQGDTGQLYDVSPVIGNYVWVVTGGTIVSGQGTNQVSVTWTTSGPQQISVTDTGVGGCSGTTQLLNVSVGAKPNASAAPIPSSCSCTNVNLDGTGSDPGMNYQWISLGGNAIVSSTSLVTSSFVCSRDTFILRVTDPASFCYRDTMIIADISTAPAAQITLNPKVICNGTPTLITLDGTGSDVNPGTTYHWQSDNPGIIITDTTALVTDATISTTTIFTLTVTNSTGCDSIVTNTVKIYPVPTISATPVLLCTSDPLLQSVITVNGPAIGSNFNWNVIPGCVSPSSSVNPSETFDFSSCGAGSYAFSVIVTDATTGCIDTLNQTITLVSGVALTMTPDVNICEGDTAVVWASGANTYLWDNGGTTDTIRVGGLIAANSPYTFSVTGTIGTCTGGGVATVYVNPVPVTSPISGPLFVCQLDSNQVYSVTPPGSTYLWTVDGGTIISGAGTDQILVNWDSSGTRTISVVDSNSFGCLGQVQTVNVIVNAIPGASVINGPSTSCATSLATYFVTPNPGSGYSWNITGGNFQSSPTDTIVSVLWGTGGTGTISIYETNANGCNGPVTTMNVIINPRPSPVSVSGNQAVCDSSFQIYTAPNNLTSTYNWFATGGTVTSVSSGTDTATVNWIGVGSGQVGVTEINSYNCMSDTTYYSVTVYLRPVASAAPNGGSTCRNVPFQLFGSANIGAVHWISSGTGTFDDTTSLTPYYIPGATDSGNVTLTLILSQFPCGDDSSSVTLFVSPAPIVTVTGTAPGNTICWGDQDILTATGGGTYLWSPGGSTNNSITVNPLFSTTYSVSVTNTYNCTTTDTLRVFVNQPGIPDAGLDQQICNGDSVFLNGTQQNAGGLFWHSYGSGTFIPDTVSSTVTYVPSPADTLAGSVLLTLTTTGACLNLIDTVTVSLSSFPTVYAGPDTILSGLGGSTLGLTPTYTNSSGIVWTTSGTGTFSPDDTTANATYVPSAADYSSEQVLLIAHTSGSCISATDTLVIDFTPFTVPNVFTPYPSSPGLNDYFRIGNLPPGSHLKIWDRWGTLVYESKDYKNNWDAANLNADTFFYILETDRKSFHGYITVLRD